MSSALAMVLTAAMAVPGNGPEMVSAEMEYGLDLRGEWEGTGQDENGEVFPVHLNMFRTQFKRPVWSDFHTPFVDEGGGKLRFRGSPLVLGIYQQAGDRLKICYRDDSRPITYRGGDGQVLLILHRVKPRK